jgi:TIR domain-containing protein
VLGGVFICYRREDSAGFARLIYDRLTHKLGHDSVFFDVDNIAPGLDFVDILSERVGKCDALIAVIGKTWVSSAYLSNERRLDDPNDFVRIEIEAALERKIRVIPVLVDGAPMPRPDDLPESLKKLPRRQGIEISHSRFDSDVDRLTRALSALDEELRRREEAERAAREEQQKREVAEAAEKAARARQLAEIEAQRAVEEREKREAAEAAEKAERALQLSEAEAQRAIEERRAAEAAEAEREGRERQEAAETARAEESRQLAEAEAARRAEEERRARESAEAQRVAHEERERREAAAVARTEQARRLAEADAARRAEAEEVRRPWEAAEAEHAAQPSRGTKGTKAALAATDDEEEEPSTASAPPKGAAGVHVLPAPALPRVATKSGVRAAVLATATGVAVVATAVVLLSQFGARETNAPQPSAKVAERVEPTPPIPAAPQAPASGPKAGQSSAQGAAPVSPAAETPNPPAVPAPSAGRAAMLVASADNPQKPVVSLGSTTWSLIPPAPGQPATVGLKAEADIPDLKMHAAMTLRKNTDPTLQATLTIDLKFSFAQGAPITGFKDVGLPQMRKEDSTAAKALTSVKVKISDTYFLIALAKGESDTARNLDLMKTRSWFDFPLLLNDDRIAKVVFQKSPEGQAMLEKAFEAWK